MLGCPFNNHSQYAWRQFSLNTYKRANIYLRLELSIFGMEMRWKMVPEKHFDADAKKRLISGMCQLTKFWEYIFGFLAGQLEIDSQPIHIHLIAPDQLATCANFDLLKLTVIVPQSKDTLTRKIGQIHNTLRAI